jgi:hypothetical protein
MLKNVRTKLAVSVALSLAAGSAQALYQDIAVNGGFENGDFSGWVQFPGSLGAAGQQITTANPASGTYAANLTEPAPAANIIKQANLLPGAWTPGQQIDISFAIRGSAAIGGVFFAELFSEIDGGGTSASVILGGGPLFPNGDPDVWTTYNFSGFAGPDTSGGITLQFNAACGADIGCVSDYFIDNVTIFADVDVPAIPVPAAVWLFGSGLLGLVGIARKKKVA